MQGVKVWDKATRIFHWSLASCMLGAWLTIELRQMDWHQYFGYTIVALITFRLLWGFFGSTTARFKAFVFHPLTAWRYLKASLQLNAKTYTGHNPAGGWMVVGFILLLIAQITTGLFSNNELGFNGALADGVSKGLSDELTKLHAIIFNVILVAIWLHLVAVFFYVLVKKHNIILAMLTGRKPQHQTDPATQIKFYSPLRFWVCLLIALLPPIYLLTLGK